MPHDSNYKKAMKWSIIGELFTHTADENYITARWYATNGLTTDFFWLAVHALEKYMKAALLFNGHSAKNYSHDIVKLHDKVEQFASDLLPADFGKPKEIDIPWIKFKPSNFLKHLYKNGNADNRYLIFGNSIHFHDLYMLDQAVFAYRRLICPLDELLVNQNIPKTPQISHRYMLKRNPRYFSPVGTGLPLDNLILNPQPTLLRHAALNMNFPFAPDNYPHENVPVRSSSRNPVLLRRIFDPLASTDLDQAKLGFEIAAWTLNNIQLPSDVRDEIKAAMDASRKQHPSLP